MAASAAPQQVISGGPRPPVGTLNRLFFDAVERHDKPDALQVKVEGAYQPISHRTMADRVRRVALGMRHLGIAPGDHVALLSENRPEWPIVDFGCLTSQVTDVPIYPTLPAEQIAFILQDAETVAIFVSTEDQAAKIAQIRDRLPRLRTVIGFGHSPWPGVDMTLAALEAAGAARENPQVTAQYREDALSVEPDDVATIIYTSGTTGSPKGAMLTHDNIFSNVQGVLQIVPIGQTDTSLSFLPLSHILERTAHYVMVAAGVSIAYAESLDTLVADFGLASPTVAVAVPRVYEKIYARVLENALAGSAVKKRIFFWARSVAERWAEVRLAGGEPRGLLAAKYAVAQKLVFSKLRARVGGRMRFFVSGGAPLAPEINRFFYAAGLTILEGYGLTETSPVICCNRPRIEDFRIGTVGRPIAGVEVTLAADGEIISRGPHIMKGYFRRPDATAEVIDEDGWFHTGDIGVIEDGFLRITDRKKEIIVTAGGKNIAPQPIENQIKTNKYVSQVVMIGDKRRYPVALVVPNYDHLEKWAKIKNLLWTDRAQLITQPVVKAKMEKEVLAKLSGLASYETPKKVALIEHDFTIEGGELTPTLKVKRRVIDQKYSALIDALYEEEAGAA